MTIEQKRLQKLSRILRKIDEYDRYIHTHYNAQEIMDVYEKGEKRKHYYGSSCGLINVIWTEADGQLDADEYMRSDSEEE